MPSGWIGWMQMTLCLFDGSCVLSVDLVLLGKRFAQLGDGEARRARHVEDHGLLAGEQVAGGRDLGGDRRGDDRRRRAGPRG